MKNILSLLLALCLCAGLGAAAAEATGGPAGDGGTSASVEIPVEFTPTDIPVDALAIGFQVPSDFVAVAVTDEQAAQGLLLNAADAAQSYSVQVYAIQADSEAFTAQLSAAEGVANIETVTVNGIEYLTYSVPASNSHCAVLFINDTHMLSFQFIVPEGVDTGTVPLQIMVSLYDL